MKAGKNMPAIFHYNEKINIWKFKKLNAKAMLSTVPLSTRL